MRLSRREFLKLSAAASWVPVLSTWGAVQVPATTPTATGTVIPLPRREGSLTPTVTVQFPATAQAQQPMDPARIDGVISAHLNRTFPAAQIVIALQGALVYSRAWGYLDPDTKTRPTTLDSRFDLASVSKLFTATAFMTLVEEGRVALDQPVSDILPEFSGKRSLSSGSGAVSSTAGTVDAGAVSFRHLLAHNSGLVEWLPISSIARREERRDAVLNAPFTYATGTQVRYSDIGLVLLGYAVEKIAGQPLDQTIRARVTRPLGLESVGFGPIPRERAVPTEFNSLQNRRMWGEVHDENAWSLGGLAGHAGLFATARDLMELGEMYRRGGSPVLKSETVAEVTRRQSEEGSVRRGIGWLLWSPDPGASSHVFSESAFGHTGFTGTSLWVDPGRQLVIACLTNRVYYGRENSDAMAAFRLALHSAVCESIDSTQK